MIKDSSEENIKAAAELLIQGDCVAFPTETVYGLGANALDASAINKIYQIKGRPANNPLIVHIASTQQLEQVADLSKQNIKKRLDRVLCFWPGPLTVILPKNKKIPEIVSAGLDTVGVRIPANEIALSLLRAANIPIAAPSANNSSYISPTKASHVADCLGEKVKMILDGGECEFGIESTVLDLTSEQPTILRPGAISHTELLKIFPELVVKDQSLESGSQRSPGLAKKHYSPKTPVRLLSSIELHTIPSNSALVSFKGQHDHELKEAFKVITPLTAHGDLKEAASRLYSTLRNLDKSNFDMIVIEDCSDDDIGLALNNRIFRAISDD